MRWPDWWLSPDLGGDRHPLCPLYQLCLSAIHGDGLPALDADAQAPTLHGPQPRRWRDGGGDVVDAGVADLYRHGTGGHRGGWPLAGTVFATFSEGWVKDIHELVANLMLLLVAAHVAGVIVSSVLTVKIWCGRCYRNETSPR